MRTIANRFTTAVNDGASHLRTVAKTGWAVGLAVLLGLVLRLAMGRGGLWLDEAWSVVLANDAGSPLGVLVGIHHDNNHPLNSWWLQLVGPSAPPLLMRGLSIACSTATIFIAARFAGRRSVWAGISTAFFFAVSPVMILLGSEARGYAPMILALVWIIDQLDAAPVGERDPPQGRLVLASLIGTLGHFVMLPALILLCGWQFFLVPGGFERRCRLTAARMGRPLLTSMLVVLFVVGMAYKVQGGLTVGSATPFSWQGFVQGLSDVTHMTFGIGPWALLTVPALLLAIPRANRSDLALWVCLGLGLPVAAALLHPSNSHIARYFVPSSVALLLCVGTRVGTIRWPLLLAPLIGVPLMVSSLMFDATLIAGQRSELDRPVRIIATQRPHGARLLLASHRLSAVVKVAAAQTGAQLTWAGPKCASGDYLLVDLEASNPTSPLRHCDRIWKVMDYRPPPYPGGVGWALYH